MILVAIRDLFFSSKVDAVVAASGAPAPLRAKRGESLMEQVRETRPSRLVLDLGAEGAIDAVRAIKSDPDIAATEIVGYCRHTEIDRIRDAKNAGCDRVLTQGELAELLPRLLAGEL